MSDSKEPKRTTYALDALKEPEEDPEWKTVTENNVAQNRKTEYRADIITVHKSNAFKIGVTAVSFGQGALLPVMSVSIFDGMECKRKERSFSILAFK